VSTEVYIGREAIHPLKLRDSLGKAYSQFRKDEPIAIGALYAGIDLAANVQVGISQTNPLVEAFRLSLRSNVLPSERDYFARNSTVLLDPFREFEGENVNTAVSNWIGTHPVEGRFSRLKNLIDAPLVVGLAARGKSLGLFYEHLAGAVDHDEDSSPKGFNDPQPRYFDLLIADFFHGKGRDLLLGFMKGSRVIDPPPARFDRDYEAIERFREEERGRWGVIASLDLVAMEAWQRYLGYGASAERRSNAALAVEKYARSITEIERLKDISAITAREAINPFQAL